MKLTSVENVPGKDGCATKDADEDARLIRAGELSVTEPLLADQRGEEVMPGCSRNPAAAGGSTTPWRSFNLIA